VGLGRGAPEGVPGQPGFQPFVARTAPFFKEIEEMEYYEPTGIGLTKAT
jgi:hypothetical protein